MLFPEKAKRRQSWEEISGGRHCDRKVVSYAGGCVSHSCRQKTRDILIVNKGKELHAVGPKDAKRRDGGRSILGEISRKKGEKSIRSGDRRQGYGEGSEAMGEAVDSVIEIDVGEASYDESISFIIRQAADK